MGVGFVFFSDFSVEMFSGHEIKMELHVACKEIKKILIRKDDQEKKIKNIKKNIEHKRT